MHAFFNVLTRNARKVPLDPSTALIKISVKQTNKKQIQNKTTTTTTTTTKSKK